MATPKKPETTIDQIVDILKEMVNEPMSDQSSALPTAADVTRARAAMDAPAPPKKKAAKKKVAKKKTTKKKVTKKATKRKTAKARARPAAKKKKATRTKTKKSKKR